MTAPPPVVDALRERYALDRELGRGGMATVYLARDLKHARFVAFKLLRLDLAAILGAERFLLYYVMPCVEGQSFRHRVECNGQLPLDEALSIIRGVASALEYACGQGVIHRDIEPENILLYRASRWWRIAASRSPRPAWEGSGSPRRGSRSGLRRT